MLITAAEPRKKNMTALFIDGEYAVSVDTVTFLSSGIRAGHEIDDDELYELIQSSNINRAKEKALCLIEYRARTKKEIEDRLLPLYGEKATGLALERLSELGLIDDFAFALEYAEMLINRKHYSRKRAEYEMIKKGIDKEIIEESLDRIDIDPVEQIKILLQTKYARRSSDEKTRAKTVNSLRAMGYNWSDINDAMNEVYDEMI